MSEPRPRTETELVEHIRSIDVSAPETLHRQVEAMVAERAPGRTRGAWLARPAVLAGAGALLLAVAVALAVGLSGGSGGGLTAGQATALTLLPATAGAPAENEASKGTQLEASVEGTAFPYWEEHFGWRSTGSRVDRVGGRTVRTVFYGNGRGQRIGYAIVSGAAAPASGGSTTWRGPTAYRVSSRGDVNVVTWKRNGHLCIVAGRGVSTGTLLALASWHERAA
ncbi:MAG TPA: hypothetical protein VL977_08390 [Solirubrobacteraceae bacterium]|nr:hypothetical protein [Solirubrobacteraceae bacterium]